MTTAQAEPAVLERSSMQKPFYDIKIFGERNTGTNALEQFLQNNSASLVVPNIESERRRTRDAFRAVRYVTRSSNLFERLVDTMFNPHDAVSAWKHAATNFVDATPFDGITVVLTLRHPASWLLAMQRAPYHFVYDVPAALADFVTTPFNTVGRERLRRVDLTPIDLYNVKLQHFLDFADLLRKRGNSPIFVKFEDIITDQPAIFEMLRSRLKNPAAIPQVLQQSTKDKAKDLDYYKNYYGKELWRAEINTAAAAKIDAGIRWDLAGRFGYAKTGEL